ncbi:hypothetical protein VTO42DRAFT_7296 [Malbranchea cinnamomea]
MNFQNPIQLPLLSLRQSDSTSTNISPCSKRLHNHLNECCVMKTPADNTASVATCPPWHQRCQKTYFSLLD